ncbi:MAG: methyltransferase domain-containing protein [Deltaproteobacteria bacterium]|nr:MAG: methyltransferase domain-containing protein [Deltaproteobacteria bacterium]
MDRALAALKAAGEPTRLRLLVLLSRCELAVTELARVLGQSQPRVSRHLRILDDAGLVERSPDGPWAFYRISSEGEGARAARKVLELVDMNDPTLANDRRRLAEVRRERARRAARYFRENAAEWDRIRSLYVGEAAVERAMLSAAGDGPLGDLVDLGTGTGRILELFADRIRHGVGIDESHEMLEIARAKLDERGAAHCQVRRGDIYAVPLADASADLVTIHHVLHFLDDPEAALREAARLLRPGGRLIAVDFAPHQLEFLRTEYEHRRLGFSDAEVQRWCRAAGLDRLQVQRLEAAGRAGDRSLTVCIWTALKAAGARRAVA